MSGARPAGGRTVVTARAIERVVRAVTADQFGVAAKAVSAELTDQGGDLELAVRTPIRVVPIGRVQDDERALDRAGGSVLDRAARGEAAIVEQVGTITGSRVARLALRFTAAEIKQERRVR
ncbi:hypothetical protein [uncultured Amnibacterium sp.]|uniref:hypothetical protein n=1 Tax=uncultured Amnibacterium sp. TaxID=1631851 RepID=UPI0035CB202B